MLIRMSLFLVSLFTITFSCNTTQEIPADLGTLNKEIEMDKSPCFGTCLHYTLTIYEKGIASFEGKRDVDKLGLHTKKLTSKEYEGVKHAFEASNFFELEDNYPSDLPDAPKTVITYHKNGKSKTVTGDFTRPQIILSLDKILTQIAESEGWTLKEAPQGND